MLNEEAREILRSHEVRYGRRMILMSIAVSFAISAYLVYDLRQRNLAKKPAPTKVVIKQLPAPPAPKIPMVKVIVAKADIRMGKKLNGEMLKIVEWPKASAPEGTFKDKAMLLVPGRERTALATIKANEPIYESKVTRPGELASLSALIDKDLNAITIRVNDIMGVGGFVKPGDRVDIMLTRGADKSRSERPVARNVAGPTHQSCFKTPAFSQSTRSLTSATIAPKTQQQQQLKSAWSMHRNLNSLNLSANCH